MSMNVLPQRLEEERRSTRSLIMVEGQPIQLTRPLAPVDDGAGSMVRPAGTPTQLPVSERCLFGITTTGRGVNQNPEQWFTTSLGERMRIVYVMIGPWDDDIKKDDFWYDDDNNKFVVGFVEPNRTFQTKAHIGVMYAAEG